MGKDIGQIYKHSQSQLSTLSTKAPVSASSELQTFSAIKLTTTYIPSITDKHKNYDVLCSQNTTQNDATITNNDDIQSCETQKHCAVANKCRHKKGQRCQQQRKSDGNETLMTKTPETMLIYQQQRRPRDADSENGNN